MGKVRKKGKNILDLLLMNLQNDHLMKITHVGSEPGTYIIGVPIEQCVVLLYLANSSGAL